MLCYGENVSFEYGGNADKETYSAMGQIENGVAVGMPMEELLGDGVTENDLSLTLAPSAGGHRPRTGQVHRLRRFRPRALCHQKTAHQPQLPGHGDLYGAVLIGSLIQGNA